MQIQTWQSQKPTIPRETDQSGTTIVNATSASTYGINPSASNQSTQTDQIHQKFVEYGKNAKEWMRKCALLLPEIDRQKIWLKKGFNSIYEYAAKLANMSQYQVNEALRTVRKTTDFPELRKIIEIKGINAVRPVLTIVNKETEHFWAEKTKNMSRHTLETYVRDYKKEFVELHVQPNTELKSTVDSKTLTVNLKPEIIAKLEKFNKGDWNELMQKFIDLYEKNLEQELKQEKSAPVTEASEHIPEKINDYVLKRSHGKCEFPNCSKKYEHLHHTNRFASDKIHDPDQIVALCSAHHDLAHKGLIKNENSHNDNKQSAFHPTSTWKIQKEPDYSNLNWYIDQQVQAYKIRAG